MAFLEVRDLWRRFPGVDALRAVSLEAEQGEVHALVGANGAGKSTLINILAGVLPPSRGEIRLGGAPFAPDSPRAAQARGIGVVYQELSLIPRAFGRGQRLPRPRAGGPLRYGRPQAPPRRDAGAAGALSSGARSGGRGRGAQRRAAADGRDRPRALDRCPRADPGRAERGALPARAGEPVRDHRDAQGRGPADPLRLAPARRDLPDRGPGDGAARRAEGRDARHRGDDAGGARAADDRPRAARASAAAGGRRPAAAARGHPRKRARPASFPARAAARRDPGPRRIRRRRAHGAGARDRRGRCRQPDHPRASTGRSAGSARRPRRSRAASST